MNASVSVFEDELAVAMPAATSPKELLSALALCRLVLTALTAVAPAMLSTAPSATKLFT